jgi:hypothetical protein
MSAASKVVDFSQAAATSGCWSRKLVNSSEGCPSLGKYRSRASTLSISNSPRQFRLGSSGSSQRMCWHRRAARLSTQSGRPATSARVSVGDDFARDSRGLVRHTAEVDPDGDV